MNKNEIKQANRKAVPKFLLIMLLSLIFGGAIGFFSAKYSLNALSDSLKVQEHFRSVYRTVSYVNNGGYCAACLLSTL